MFADVFRAFENVWTRRPSVYAYGLFSFGPYYHGRAVVPWGRDKWRCVSDVLKTSEVRLRMSVRRISCVDALPSHVSSGTGLCGLLLVRLYMLTTASVFGRVVTVVAVMVWGGGLSRGRFQTF